MLNTILCPLISRWSGEVVPKHRVDSYSMTNNGKTAPNKWWSGKSILELGLGGVTSVLSQHHALMQSSWYLERAPHNAAITSISTYAILASATSFGSAACTSVLNGSSLTQTHVRAGLGSGITSRSCSRSVWNGAGWLGELRTGLVHGSVVFHAGQINVHLQ